MADVARAECLCLRFSPPRPGRLVSDRSRSDPRGQQQALQQQQQKDGRALVSPGGKGGGAVVVSGAQQKQQQQQQKGKTPPAKQLMAPSQAQRGGGNVRLIIKAPLPVASSSQSSDSGAISIPSGKIPS